jgi:hypothetical protein
MLKILLERTRECQRMKSLNLPMSDMVCADGSGQREDKLNIFLF